MIRAIPSAAGPSPAGRTALGTETLGPGALPQPVERAAALGALGKLVTAQCELFRFAQSGAVNDRVSFHVEVMALLADALRATLDIERARILSWPAHQERADRLVHGEGGIKALMAEISRFQEVWGRG